MAALILLVNLKIQKKKKRIQSRLERRIENGMKTTMEGSTGPHCGWTVEALGQGVENSREDNCRKTERNEIWT